jgi:hypothetical protein
VRGRFGELLFMHASVPPGSLCLEPCATVHQRPKPPCPTGEDRLWDNQGCLLTGEAKTLLNSGSASFLYKAEASSLVSGSAR